MANINTAFPSTYLKASDLGGREVVVTIDHVSFESVGRDREMKAVVHFQGKDKGMVLNKTNARKIAQLAGTDETDDWGGVKIKIYPTETEFGGETVDCIRIKPAGAATAPVKPLITRRAAPDADDEDIIPF